MRRDSSVDIATRYGLDGPWIESLWGRDIPYSPRPALDLTQTPVQWVRSHSRGQRRPGLSLDINLPFSVDVKEIVEILLLSFSVFSWSVLGGSLPLH